MTPQHEEALRFLTLADRDIALFVRIKNDLDVHISLVLFHAQQAVEKCLKAVLFERSIPFRRTHDLYELGQLLAARCLLPPCSKEDLSNLSPYGVTFRYDDSPVTLIGRDEAGRVVGAVRRWAGEQVGIAE